MLQKMMSRMSVKSAQAAKIAMPIAGTQSRSFGIVQEYTERKNKKLINNLLCTERPTYWVTSSRPSNFGDPLDAKTKADNWFDENRLWNEENRDYEVRRA